MFMYRCFSCGVLPTVKEERGMPQGSIKYLIQGQNYKDTPSTYYFKGL